jgi:thiomorpholine-carboxylate dehydrogenase
LALPAQLTDEAMLTLTDADVAALLTYDRLIPAMERALAAFSMGEVVQPTREMLTIEEGKRYLGVMPAVGAKTMGAKLVAFYPGNAEAGLDTHFATILLFETAHGRPLAAIEGRLITEMRTAAVSTAVTKRLARPGARSLALLGAGVQAKAHLEALRTLFRFDDVRVWSRTPARARDFAQAHGARAMAIEDAVRGADVVVTATHALDPILMGRWLAPGAHVNAIGAPRPNWRELDDAAMRNVLIVDSRAAAQKESGDVIMSGAEIFAEAGELFAGLKSPPASVTTVFKSVGLAIEDIAAAELVYERALERR